MNVVAALLDGRYCKPGGHVHSEGDPTAQGRTVFWLDEKGSLSERVEPLGIQSAIVGVTTGLSNSDGGGVEQDTVMQWKQRPVLLPASDVLLETEKKNTS